MSDNLPTEFEEYDPLLIAKLSEAYEAELTARHEMGAKKYGPVKFLQVNSLAMAMEEVADLGNYARYTWIKLALLSAQLQDVEIKVVEDLPEGFTNPYRKKN